VIETSDRKNVIVPLIHGFDVVHDVREMKQFTYLNISSSCYAAIFQCLNFSTNALPFADLYIKSFGKLKAREWRIDDCVRGSFVFVTAP